MNEDINEAMNKVLKTIELWQENKDRETALQLELLLSILKLLVGVNNFDELPAFARYLNEAHDWLLEDDQAKANIEKARTDINQSINNMIESTNKLTDGFSKDIDYFQKEVVA